MRRRFVLQMSKSKFIAIRNQTDSNTLELYFLDVITDTYDWWSGMIYSRVQEIIDKVNAYQPSKIKLIIDSVGGDAQIGLAIYNYLKRVDAKIEVEVIGLAGSIASVIAMSANKGKLRIARNAFMMIHKAQGVTGGTSDELRQAADLVDKYTEQCVDIYSQRTGKPVEEINALMANGDYWMTGQESVTQGFADETFNDAATVQIAARLDTSIYKNIPAQIRAQLKPAAEGPEDFKTILTNQFAEMKKFFTDIVNAFRNTKPAANATPETLVTNLADSIQKPFEDLGEQMDTTIDSKVNEVTGSEAFVTKVANKAKEGLTVPTIDFTVDGPAKTALENAAKVAVAAATTQMATQITALEDGKIALELEITNLKGAQSNTSNNENTKKPIGGFK